MIVPLLIAGITTVIGYGSLLWTNVPGVFEVGAFSVFGVAATTLLSFTGLPATLALMPLPPVAAPGARPDARVRFATRLGPALDRGLARLTAFTTRRAGAIVLGWAVVGAVCLGAVPSVVVDTDYLSFFDARSPVRRDFEAVNRLLAGAIPLYVVIEGGGPGSLRDP